MNEDYYHEQNSCYDHNSFGFDQVQPPQYTVNHPIFNSQNELLNSQNKLMEQMATLRDLVDQVIQKKEEEKRIAEEQAAKDRSWKIPICYDDDEDNTIAITPVLPIEEPDNSLSMGDEHLDTIPETESDEVIKSSVENLIPIPSESEGIPDSVCDVPLCKNTTSLNALNEHSEIVVNSYVRPCGYITFGDLAKQVPKSYLTLCNHGPCWLKLMRFGSFGPHSSSFP
ncbi:hypothetical protein Tco_0740256 [Tanacetum coccineum]